MMALSGEKKKKLREMTVEQLKLLKELCNEGFVMTRYLGNVSGERPNPLGGRLGTLSREGWAKKAGKKRWKLNDDVIDRDELVKFLEEELGIK